MFPAASAAPNAPAAALDYGMFASNPLATGHPAERGFPRRWSTLVFRHRHPMPSVVIVPGQDHTAASPSVLDGVVRQILETATTHFGIPNAALFLVESRTAALRLLAYAGSAEQEAVPVLPLARGIAGAAATARQSVYAPDVNRDERFIRTI